MAVLLRTPIKTLHVFRPQFTYEHHKVPHSKSLPIHSPSTALLYIYTCFSDLAIAGIIFESPHCYSSETCTYIVLNFFCGFKIMILDSTHASWGEPQVAGKWLAFNCSPKTVALKGTCDGVHCHAAGSTWKDLLSVCSAPICTKCQFCLLSVKLPHTFLMSWLMLLVCYCTAVFKSVEPVVNSRFLRSCMSPTTMSFKGVSTADFSSIYRNLMFTCCFNWDIAISVSGTSLQHR
jgi:hypothetical protein